MRRTGQPLCALDALNFTIERGEFVALVGPSGCGKTTLLNVVAGLLPLTRGALLLDGRPLTGPGAERALVFQTPALLPWRTVLDNAAYGLELQGVKRPAARQRARQFLDLVGLRGFEASYPRELSGGMQQRVNLARALALEPALLLFDEPLAALDAQTREAMQVELERIWLRTQATALFVTHQISEAIYLADRVLVLTGRPGQLKAELAIELPRPRPPHCRRLPYFADLDEQIRELLRPASLPVGQAGSLSHPAPDEEFPAVLNEEAASCRS